MCKSTLVDEKMHHAYRCATYQLRMRRHNGKEVNNHGSVGILRPTQLLSSSKRPFDIRGLQRWCLSDHSISINPTASNFLFIYILFTGSVSSSEIMAPND
jgi:hypothetical protein